MSMKNISSNVRINKGIATQYQVDKNVFGEYEINCRGKICVSLCEKNLLGANTPLNGQAYTMKQWVLKLAPLASQISFYTKHLYVELRAAGYHKDEAESIAEKLALLRSFDYEKLKTDILQNNCQTCKYRNYLTCGQKKVLATADAIWRYHALNAARDVVLQYANHAVPNYNRMIMQNEGNYIMRYCIDFIKKEELSKKSNCLQENEIWKFRTTKHTSYYARICEDVFDIMTSYFPVLDVWISGVGYVKINLYWNGMWEYYGWNEEIIWEAYTEYLLGELLHYTQNISKAMITIVELVDFLKRQRNKSCYSSLSKKLPLLYSLKLLYWQEEKLYKAVKEYRGVAAIPRHSFS